LRDAQLYQVVHSINIKMSAIIFTIGFLLTILFLVILFFQIKHQYWKKRNVPHIKPEFFYGNSRGMGTKYAYGAFWKKMYLKLKTKKPIVGTYIYFYPSAMITDLDLVKTIMVKEFDTFPNRGGYCNEKDDPASANIATLDNERWRYLRNKLSPTFTSGKLKLMFPIVAEVVDNMLTRISQKSIESTQLDIKDISSRLAIDIIGRTAFGIECDSLFEKDNEFYRYGLKAFSSLNVFKRFWVSRFPEIARKLHITISNKEVVNFYRDIVLQTIKYREENNIESNDFMGMMIKMKNSSQPLTFNEIWAQSIMFFAAGFETTATALTFCLYELSIQKDFQQKARECVLSVLKKYNGEFTYEGMSEMHYVEQCINGKQKINDSRKILQMFNLF
jgi:cytochrome P450 family 6